MSVCSKSFGEEKSKPGQKNQQTDLGKWGHRFVSKNKKQICEDKKPKKLGNTILVRLELWDLDSI